jgi:hypothetical protein
MFARLTALVLFAALFAGGCRDGSKKEAEHDPLELQPTSIAHVLALFQEACQGRDYDRYAALFDTSYEYLFAPQDVGGPNNIPEAWGRADELLSALHMFRGDPNRDGYRAEEIQLTFTAGPEEAVEGHPDWRKVVLSRVELQVIARHQTTHDLLIYQVLGDKEDFYFVPTNETAPGTDLQIWKIVRWEDKPIFKRNAKVRTATWGQIKAIWE